ncbi:MAG TPA: M23 family metallopeptidase, partial [Bdellovibrio sp.]|nr:M23 family metallopeptidase [Bdellovibrio sp.]
GQICIRKEKDKPAVCEMPPVMAPLKNLILPFDSKEEVYCTHSSGSGSHSWTNAFYALDLANSYDKPASTILAAADGKAFVFLGEDGKLCPEPAGNPQKADTNACGSSWGNHIKILHDGGYYTFYVHLDRVLIANGSMVKKGQPIGIEGWTGAAGHRHLHWSVQKLPGATSSDWEKRISWAGESVPFQFQAYVNGNLQTVDTSSFQCAHAGIGQAAKGQQPILKRSP